MNNQAWKEMLVNTPEAAEKVHSRLHRDIMRAVRLAQPSGGKSTFSRTVPARVAGVFAMLMLMPGIFLYLSGTESGQPSPASVVIQSPVEAAPAVSLLALEKHLRALTTETVEPEHELRKELERLKTDLARFGFSS